MRAWPLLTLVFWIVMSAPDVATSPSITAPLPLPADRYARNQDAVPVPEAVTPVMAFAVATPTEAASVGAVGALQLQDRTTRARVEKVDDAVTRRVSCCRR